jgi:CDP-6-deoxy-D-xylo-4-hexulose-3-dehydrase
MCLRAHGWSRELSNRAEVEARHPNIDRRFLFVNTGYNLRPLEVQAAMGLCQLQRLPEMNANRVRNFARLVGALQAHPRWDGRFRFPVPSEGLDPVWFGVPILLAQRVAASRGDYLTYLSDHGIENRPIVSGNFTRQPALALHGIAGAPRDFPGAETVNETGFFIGLHTEPLDDRTLATLVELLLAYEFPR